MQGILLAAMERPIEKALFYQAQTPFVPLGYGLAALASAGTAIGITLWAATVDAGLVNPQRKRRGMTGIAGGAQPVDLTLTVIGGRESGKTVLLAAAYYEWTTQNVGNLRITPTTERDSRYEGGTNLEEVARELYVDNHFPVGTVSTRNLPFDLALNKDAIARFNFLDYPGGALAGHGADSEIVKEFWDRVDDTDGLILIADMSYVRRSQKDSDWIDVRNAYRTVMQRVVDRNGKRRVVPVALVLTKCDEYINLETGQLDKTALEADLRKFQYDELETEWRQLSVDRGPGFAEFRTFITSAITYSEPQTDAFGRPDLKKPFVIPPPPPNITPAGCASPLLWISSKVMRWNVTLFADLGTFLFGSSPRVRRRVEAVLEMDVLPSSAPEKDRNAEDEVRKIGSVTSTARGKSGSPFALPVRWIVFFTGDKASDDYQPYASEGETPDVIREVTDLCRAFHPHSEVRLFPSDRDVYLFWKTTTTSEWVVTRVSLAPNPNGLRTALEYCSLVFSPEAFGLLRCNPFRTESLKLHDQARQNYLDNNHTPIFYNMAFDAAGAAAVPRPSTPALTGDTISTPENVRALQEFSAGTTDPPTPPPTFATWWTSRGNPPTGYFDIVLRAAAPRSLSVREATKMAFDLAELTKSSLPIAPEGDSLAQDLSRAIVSNTDTLQASVAEAVDNLNRETRAQFTQRMEKSSRLASQIGRDLLSFDKRLEQGGVTVATRAPLGDLSEQYEILGNGLSKVRHPSGFAQNDIPANTDTSPTPFSSGSGLTTSLNGNPSAPRQGLGAGAIAGIAAVGLAAVFGIWKAASPKPAPIPVAQAGKGAEEDPFAVPPVEKPSPKASAATPEPAPQTPAQILQAQEVAVTSVAIARARDDARDAAEKGTGSPLSETRLEKIATQAIQAAYREKLPSADFNAAFKDGEAWTYAKFQKTLIAMLPAVHDAALAGSTTGASVAAKRAEAARVAAAPTPKATKATPEPTPKPTPKHVRSTPEPPQHVRASPKPTPERTPPPRHSTPSAGSAGQTGL